MAALLGVFLLLLMLLLQLGPSSCSNVSEPERSPVPWWFSFPIHEWFLP